MQSLVSYRRVVLPGPELLSPVLFSVYFSGDVTPDVLDEAREVGDVFRRWQWMTAIAHRAEPRELNIKQHNRPSQNTKNK